MIRFRSLSALALILIASCCLQGCASLLNPNPPKDTPSAGAKYGWNSSNRMQIRSSFAKD